MGASMARSAMPGRAALASLGLPEGDDAPLTVSGGTFPSRAHYGVEMPAINTYAQLVATIDALVDQDVYCTRFDETHGSHLLSDAEITDMLGLCAEHGMGFLFGIGPRPEYDTKASFYRTPFGLEMGRQLNNNDAMAQAVDEALRLCSLGCRGLTIYDIGVMDVLKALRERGEIPAGTVFKTSSHCMATNAPIARIFADCGADSITTAHDLGLPMLQAMRGYVPDLVLDVPTDVYKTKGGYIRWFELAEIVQVASPVILKMGASVQAHPYDPVRPEAAAERVRRVRVGLEYLRKHLPTGYRALEAGDRFACVSKTRAPQPVEALS